MDYVETEISWATKGVKDSEAAVQQKQEETRKAENPGLTNGELNQTFEEMMVATRDTLSDLASSDDGEDGEDGEDEETEQGKLSEDDEPSWVMHTISKSVQQHMERFRQKQIWLDKVTQPGWEEEADHFRERDKMYCTSQLRVRAVVKLWTDDDAAAPAQTTYGEVMECIDIVPRISQMLQGTSRPGSGHIGLRSWKPQSNMSLSSPAPTAKLDSSISQNVQPVDFVSFHPCMWSPQLITIQKSDWEENMVTAPV